MKQPTHKKSSFPGFATGGDGCNDVFSYKKQVSVQAPNSADRRMLCVLPPIARRAR
jgi:hypothetical protein